MGCLGLGRACAVRFWAWVGRVLGLGAGAKTRNDSKQMARHGETGTTQGRNGTERHQTARHDTTREETGRYGTDNGTGRPGHDHTQVPACAWPRPDT